MTIRRMSPGLVVLISMLAVPVGAYAQEAIINGTVTDSTGGVLPGVTVTALHTATGNTFFSVTDTRGVYQIQARIGAFRVTAELPGFTTLSREGITLQVGQQATLDLQMAPEGLQTTVQVTAEAPLLNTTQSIIGSNIDSRQMSELPVQGRQWSTLALLAPGNRTTAIGENPVQDRSDMREFQLNMDGQQVTQNTGVGGQPRYSRDAIAEFQFISNRFDATQGRSSGTQVNAISKSGTNQFAGTFSTAFRDDRWNAPDPVTGLVTKIKNQQYSGTYGGPVLRNRLHFFANYEYEREPKANEYNTGYPSLNIDLPYDDTKKLMGLRLDTQLSSRLRIYTRGSLSVENTLGAGGGGHPAAAAYNYRKTNDLIVGFTQVLNNSTINVVRLGYSGFHYTNSNTGYNPNHWQAPNGITSGAPRITFAGFSIGGNVSSPQDTSQNDYTMRDDFSTSYNLGGRHDLKIGGEYRPNYQGSGNCRNCMGVIVANRSGVTLPKPLDQYVGGGPGQDIFNAATWDLNGLAPLVVRYTVGIAENKFHWSFGRKVFASWVQDDWSVTNRLTLNLGVRYDLIMNAFANEVAYLPWIPAGRPNETRDIQPRGGFAFKLNDTTVLRGGGGLYYGDTPTNPLSRMYSAVTTANIEIPNDGRPDFVTNPFNGPLPTFAQAQTRFCNVNGSQPGCLRKSQLELAPFPPSFSHLPYSWQGSFGFAKQLGSVISFEADYVQTNTRNEKYLGGNANIKYDPVTGNNLPYTNVNNRVFSDWAAVSTDPMGGWSDYRGLQTSFTKRFSNRWQASGNYLLSKIMDSKGNPVSGTEIVPFKVAPDLGEDYAVASTDQRHRFVVNGIYQAPRGFQVSGLYFFGNGSPQQITPGTTDVRDLGENGDYPNRRRLNGEIIPRNTFHGPAIHRVDMRIQQRIPLRGTRAGLDLQFEVFNVFDRFNPSSFVTNESNIRYGLPNSSTNLAYAPRVLQLGFRTTF